ncbi:MAG: hypothetical protein SPI12_00245 [Actinomycetaceae bacterium]|nr:hypothetical protein [Actinomycetaceae bacterium]MDY6082284.1 hypothetical protein [Actinomycetaceae bacterium]
MKIRKYILAALAASTALTLGACSGGSPSSSDSSGPGNERPNVSFDDIQREYQNSIAQLSWPKGFNPPATLEGEDKSAHFQTGYGDTRASMVFECAWSQTWLDTYATDKATADTALKELEKVPSMGYMSKEHADDNTRRIFKENLDKAKLGDPSGIQDNVSVNCD